MTRVLIVQNHAVVAQGLSVLLDRQADLEPTGTAGDGGTAVALACATRPDVVLLDYQLRDIAGADVARAIRLRQPKTPILFLSEDDSDQAVLEAVDAGARAYLHKSRAAAELVAAIRRVAKGEMLISGATMTRIRQRRAEVGDVFETLTAREQEILRLMAHGLESKTIARQLGIRYGTVRSHFRNLSGKLGAHSKIEAVAKARQFGCLTEI